MTGVFSWFMYNFILGLKHKDFQLWRYKPSFGSTCFAIKLGVPLIRCCSVGGYIFKCFSLSPRKSLSILRPHDFPTSCVVPINVFDCKIELFFQFNRDQDRELNPDSRPNKHQVQAYSLVATMHCRCRDLC